MVYTYQRAEYRLFDRENQMQQAARPGRNVRNFPVSVRALMLALSALSAACAMSTPPAPAGTPAARQAGMDAHAGMQMQMPELPASPGQGFTVADVRFMQNMIGHHAQAIDMAEMAPGHGASDAVLKLARKIDISQRDEIGLMQRWLRERAQVVPTDSQAHAMMMPGMLSPGQMAQLSASHGHDFDRLFLTFMIQHHQGALQMVDELFASPNAGQDSDLFRFATDAGTDQRDEILVMQRLLDVLSH